MHEYGLKEIGPYRYGGRDFDWEKKPIPKRVILVNVAECEEKITVKGMTRHLMGMGKIEWEIRLAGWLIEAVLTSIEHGEEEADITELFSHDLIGWDSTGEYRNSQENVARKLIEKIFEVVEESDEEIRVKLIKID